MIYFTLDVSGTDNNNTAVEKTLIALANVNCHNNVLHEGWNTGILSMFAHNTTEAYFMFDTIFGKADATNPRTSNEEILLECMGKDNDALKKALEMIIHLEKVIQVQKQNTQSIRDYVGLDKFKGSIENRQVNVEDIHLRLSENNRNLYSVEGRDYSPLGE